MNMPETSTKTQPADIWSRLKSEDASALGDWLHWHPSRLESCVEARAEKRPPPLNAEELEELREAHRRWGADEASLASIEKLGSPNARVVATGQQPTPLAGPMYVAYKTLATVDLAREFSEMIVTQRAYSASGKIITTSDQMLEELIRLKR